MTAVNKGGGAPILSARDIDRAMDLVRTSTLSLNAIGALWLISGTAIRYHMERLGVTRGDFEIRRFWSKVDQSGDCWPWMAGRTVDGYGHVNIDHETWITHRLAYALTYGRIPQGMLVCHTCDNPPCCNPDHLFLGTNADNSHDRDRKGRQRNAATKARERAQLPAFDQAKWSHDREGWPA